LSIFVGAGPPLGTSRYAEGAAKVFRQKEEDQAKVECCRVKIPQPDFNLNSLERSSARHYAMVLRFLIAAIALLILGVLGWYSGYAEEVQGRAALRRRWCRYHQC
jgi:hypothetical protein